MSGGAKSAKVKIKGQDNFQRFAPSEQSFCRKCGAWEGVLGLEPTPELYAQHIVEIFREVRRVLRDDGTVWLNLGDSYYGSGKGLYGDGTSHGTEGKKQLTNKGSIGVANSFANSYSHSNLKPKDLVGIPWRVAFALQADGWWLRDAIVWAKAWVDEDNENDGTVMPGSQRDRCTTAYEMIFMLTKSRKYYFDIDGQRTTSGATMRNTWRINTSPYKGSHFATFPPKLVERCVLLGTSAKGCCPICGAPRERVIEETRGGEPLRWTGDTKNAQFYLDDTNRLGPGIRDSHRTIGWRPICNHNVDPVPCVVLDPFVGSGTTVVVAEQLGRKGIGLDLNPDYLELAKERIRKSQPGLPSLGI